MHDKTAFEQKAVFNMKEYIIERAYLMKRQ